MNRHSLGAVLHPARRLAFAAALIASLVLAPVALAGHALGGADVKISLDNNNVDGGVPNPGFDAQNRQANETSVAINPANPQIMAAAANDYRMVTVTGDVWYGLYVSRDSGASWFNTFIPGFPGDTSAAGLASPLLGLDASGDPVVRFDRAGNLYATAIAFNRNFDQADRPVDVVVYTARYDYTPGTPGGASTPTSAANPPDYTYRRTTVVERGAVGFAVPGAVGFAGNFVDKEWMEIDLNTSQASACAGSIYVTHTSFHGARGNSPIRFSRSTDGGVTFSKSKVVSTGGAGGTPYNQGSDIAVGPDGTVYIAYTGFDPGTGSDQIRVVKSSDCGKHWSQPVATGPIVEGQALGVAFRTPTFAFISADDTDPNIVYVAYQTLVGTDFEVYVQQSTDGGATWSAPVRASDTSSGHQIFPTIDVKDGVLHVAWYDFRNSPTAANEALDVYYACSNCDGSAFPAFSHNVQVTDISHNGNCLLFGGGTSAFHGDYIELDAYSAGGAQQVLVAWADNRDVTPCDLDPAAGPPSNNTGNRNANIYGDVLTVTP